MGVPLTYVLTHDSIGVGEDGPTHEPIEQLAMLRAMPNFYVYRPADATECAAAWYILEDSTKDTPDAIIIATGSEVSLAVEAKKELAAENIDVRVVSMPCMDLFEDQPDEYKDAILPKNVTARVGVEALSEFGWGKYIGINGEFVGMKSFGASAPGNQLFEHFGITKDAVVAAVKKTLN